jgi:hypothetical protein
MKKLLIGAALCSLVAAPALAGEPAKLSLAQMDKVTAGAVDLVDICTACANFNWTSQTAVAAAVGGSSAFSAFSSNAAAEAENENETEQEIN